MTERLSLGFWLRTTLVIGGLNLQAKSYLHIIICLKPGWNYKGWRKKRVYKELTVMGFRGGRGQKEKNPLWSVNLFRNKGALRRGSTTYFRLLISLKNIDSNGLILCPLLSKCFYECDHKTFGCEMKDLKIFRKKSQIDWGNDLCRKNEKKKSHGKLLRIRFSLLTTGCKRHDQFYALVQRVLCIIF